MKHYLISSKFQSLFLGDILRNKFGFKGYVVSDEGAIESIDTDFKYTKSKNMTAKGIGCDKNISFIFITNKYP